MSANGCCCAGRCRPSLPYQVSRRDFLHSVAMASAGLGLLSANAASAMSTARVPPSKVPGTWQYCTTPARIYKGANLEAVSMPIGGIGTGTVWLDGQGRLAIWQIFNNYGENRIPGSFFAIKAAAAGKPPVTRVLQTAAEEPLVPVQSLTYEGGYPIARLAYADSELPVSVKLEAYNPMIPTDAGSSSIPCAIFRFTVKNTGSTATDVSMIGTCQNAIGSSGAAVKGVAFDGYGRNRNRVVRDEGFVSLAMEKVLEPVNTCPVKVRTANGQLAAAPEMHWFSRMDGFSLQNAEILGRIAKSGGVAVAADVQPAFLADIKTMARNPEELVDKRIVFEDFEKDTYEGWAVSGEAFGKGPSTGTHPGQQQVRGFAGKRLVNTFLPGDGPHGTLS